MADIPAYRVTNVVDTTMHDPAVGLVTGKQVHFTTATGHKSKIDVLDSEFDPDKVHEMLSDMSGRIMAVATMSGNVLHIPDQVSEPQAPDYSIPNSGLGY